MDDDLLKYLGGDPRLEKKPTSQVHPPEYVSNYFASLDIGRLLLHHNFTQPNAASVSQQKTLQLKFQKNVIIYKDIKGLCKYVKSLMLLDAHE